MSIAIVPVAESHILSFHACLDAVCRERKFLAKIEALPAVQFGRWVRETIASDAIQFLAIDGTTVVGWCDIFAGWSHGTRHRGSVGMGVRRSHRGRGIGRQLLTTCLAKARAKGMTRIELEVFTDNLVAIRLYEKLGFVREAEKRNAVRLDGVYYDTVLMSLLYG